MVSALDRPKSRILLRANKLQPLIHEMAHLYLDLRWKILPYAVSEPFVQALAHAEKCQLPLQRYSSGESIRAAWKDRENLSRCELQGLLRSILLSGGDLRETLPLR